MPKLSPLTQTAIIIGALALALWFTQPQLL